MHPGFITSNMTEESVAFSSVVVYKLRFREIHE